MLRNGDALHGSTPQYLHALEQLFKLAEEPGADEPPAAPPMPAAETVNEDAGAQEKRS